MNPVISQWQRLASMDPESSGFLPLLSSLTSGDNRSSVINLHDTEASLALDAMDQLLRDSNIRDGHRNNILYLTRRLAYNSGTVPSRYQVDRDSLDREPAVISNGSFADVRKGKLGVKVVAIRTLKVDRETGGDNSRKLFCKECILWMNFSHPNLLPLIAVDIDTNTGQCSMVSEMMLNGNIREYIHKNSTNRHRLLEQVAAGLYYLHDRDIVHGDLKGHNILLTNEDPPRACLTDFGLSAFAPDTQGVTNTITAGGTPIYMAPELLVPAKFGSASSRPTKPADIYALGMVIFEVLSGCQPFYERKWDIFEVIYHVVGGERPAKPDNAEQVGFGDGVWELVEACWVEELTTRPTIDRVLSHLTRVAAASMVLDPTHEDFPEPGPFSKTQLYSSGSGITSPASTINTVNTLLSKASTSITSVPSKGSEHSHRNVKSPSESGVGSLVTRSLSKLPFRHSVLASRLWIDTEKMLTSTIPMPIFVVKKPENPAKSFSRRENYIPIDQQTVFSQWQNLKELGSIDHQQLAQLVDVRERRDISLQLKGKEAAVVINVIDKALKQNGCPEETKLHAFKVLRKLAGDTCQVPESYLIGRWTRYTVEKEIVASGGFADVREGRLGKRVVAVKTIRTTRETDVNVTHKVFCKESVLWMNISHPNILQLLAVEINPDAKRFSMISEMMTNGHIMTYISVEKADRLGLLKDVANGLRHLHGLGIIHGDLKGPNILINNETPPHACISDFGLCAIAPWMSFDPTTRRNPGGTLSHFAPELFLEGARHGKETDIYAFGVVVYQVIIGAHSSSSPWAVGLPRPEDPAACGFGQGTWEFVEKCCDKDHRKRPTVEEALEHFERVSVPPILFDPSPKPHSQGVYSESSRLNISS